MRLYLILLLLVSVKAKSAQKDKIDSSSEEKIIFLDDFEPLGNDRAKDVVFCQRVSSTLLLIIN